MQSQNIPSPTGSAQLLVRPEVKASTLDLLDAEAEHFRSDSDPSSPGYAAGFGSLATAIREGRRIDLDADLSPDGGTVAREVMLAIRSRFDQVSSDGDEPHNWRYLSDLAALAADLTASHAD